MTKLLDMLALGDALTAFRDSRFYALLRGPRAVSLYEAWVRADRPFVSAEAEVAASAIDARLRLVTIHTAPNDEALIRSLTNSAALAFAFAFLAHVEENRHCEDAADDGQVTRGARDTDAPPPLEPADLGEFPSAPPVVAPPPSTTFLEVPASESF